MNSIILDLNNFELIDEYLGERAIIVVVGEDNGTLYKIAQLKTNPELSRTVFWIRKEEHFKIIWERFRVYANDDFVNRKFKELDEIIAFSISLDDDPKIVDVITIDDFVDEQKIEESFSLAEGTTLINDFGEKKKYPNLQIVTKDSDAIKNSVGTMVILVVLGNHNMNLARHAAHASNGINSPRWTIWVRTRSALNGLVDDIEMLNGGANIINALKEDIGSISGFSIGWNGTVADIIKPTDNITQIRVRIAFNKAQVLI